MFSPKDKGSEYLKDKIFVGFVEDNLDDKRKGRIKVRVQGVFNDIEVDHIPWASPFRSLDGRSFCVPANGKIVNVIFPEGNLYEPQYIYSENYNINLKNKLDEYSDDEYKNFVALLFDDRTQIYSDDSALNLDYYDNVIRIKKNDIDIKLKDNTQVLNLGTSNANQDAVLGTNFFRWFDSFMQILLIPSTLTGNVAAPILRPLLDQKILEYQSLRSSFVSNNVKIVNNYGVRDDSYDRNKLKNIIKDDKTSINNVKLLDTDNTNTIIKDKIKNDREKSLDNALISAPIEFLPTPEPITDTGTTITGATESIWFHVNPVYNGHDININNDIIKLEKTPEIEASKITIIDKLEKDPYAETETNSDDPYAGFWSNRKGRTRESFHEQDGYGSYSTTTTSDEGFTDAVDDTPVTLNIPKDAKLSSLKIERKHHEKLGKLANKYYKQLNPALGTLLTTNSAHACPVGTGAWMAALLGDGDVKYLACESADQFAFPKSKKPKNVKSPSYTGGIAGIKTGDKKVLSPSTNTNNTDNVIKTMFGPGKSQGLYESGNNKYYQKKIKPSKTYKSDKSQWQIGDVMVCAYKSNDWGHIQIYNGYMWVSDFHQCNKDFFSSKIFLWDYLWLGGDGQEEPNTWALWRLNESGVKRVITNFKNIFK